MPKPVKTKKLDVLASRMEKSLFHQEALAEWEARTERIIEEKVYEIRGIVYLLLLISTILLGLVLGMVLNALGFRL